MKHIKPYNESKISDYKINKFYKSVQLIFSELIDSCDLDIMRESEHDEEDITLGEFVKIHIPIPLSVSSPESGGPNDLENYINSMDKWNELLKDIDVGLKRLEEEFPNITYYFEFSDYVDIVFDDFD